MKSIKIIKKLEYDDVLIVFSSLQTKKGKFEFYNNIIDLPINIILVNDYENNWYLSGTPEFSSDLEMINFLLKNIFLLKTDIPHPNFQKERI